MYGVVARESGIGDPGRCRSRGGAEAGRSTNAADTERDRTRDRIELVGDIDPVLERAELADSGKMKDRCLLSGCLVVAGFDAERIFGGGAHIMTPRYRLFSRRPEDR